MDALTRLALVVVAVGTAVLVFALVNGSTLLLRVSPWIVWPSCWVLAYRTGRLRQEADDMRDRAKGFAIVDSGALTRERVVAAFSPVCRPLRDELELERDGES